MHNPVKNNMIGRAYLTYFLYVYEPKSIIDYLAVDEKLWKDVLPLTRIYEGRVGPLCHISQDKDKRSMGIW